MIKKILIICCFFMFIQKVYACGPFFDDAYLLRPIEDTFYKLYEPIFFKLISQRFDLKSEFELPEEGSNKTLNEDISDLKSTLKKLQYDDNLSNEIVEAYKIKRNLIAKFLDEDNFANDFGWYSGRFRSFKRNPMQLRNNLAEVFQTYPNLPLEFELYIKGAAYYHNNQFDEAIKVWSEILRLDQVNRRYKSVWAAFMIGKSYLSLDQQSAAIKYFQLTRELKEEKFIDSLDLAFDSYGWQALAEFESGNYNDAINHYVKQMDINSLSWVINKVIMKDDEVLIDLLKDDISAEVLFLWIFSKADDSLENSDIVRVLKLIEEQSEKISSKNYDKLALIYYNLGDFEKAEKLISKIKKDTPISIWINSKILIKNGNFKDGLTMLRKTLPYLEKTKDEDAFSGSNISEIQNKINSEIGLLYLKRQDFILAFDYFLKGQFWEDAAYMAERVLTLNELEQYLNSHKKQVFLSSLWYQRASDDPNKELVYLMARRFARQGNYEKALKYLPKTISGNWLNRKELEENGKEIYFEEISPTKVLIAYREALKLAANDSIEKKDRAKNYFEAAMIMRDFGMEIFGTELDPDWFGYNGQFDLGDSLERRFGVVDFARVVKDKYYWISDLELVDNYAKDVTSRRNQNKKERNNNLFVGSDKEEHRAVESKANPFRRFHYRYKAAELMWKAAELLPDNDLLKANALYLGGIFVKDKDVVHADKFYKELVTKCGKTNIGIQADKLKWFPKQNINKE